MKNNLKDAIQFARRGEDEAASRILWQILLREPDNESAWLWMSQVQRGDRQRLECLQQVLRINPENHFAQLGADYINSRLGIQESRTSPAVVVRRPKYTPRKNLVKFLLLTMLCATLLGIVLRIIKN